MLFLKILNMSLAANWAILAVLVLRLCLKKAPRGLRCLLWGLVGVRLACPFTVQSILSLIPSAEVFDAHNIQYEMPRVHTGIPAVNRVIDPVLAANFAPDPTGSINPLHALLGIAAFVWCIGMACLVLYAAVSCLRVYGTVREAIPLQENIYLCDTVHSPFLFGVLRPRIYLPSGLPPASVQPVIAHEKAHLVRRDHWWKALGFLMLTVHWFNPLCWLSYFLLCRDIELACDERVIRSMTLTEKKAYSAALLDCSVRRRPVTVCPLAFGEVGVRQRIKSVLSYKKPAVRMIAVSALVCAAAAVCFLTDPKAEGSEPDLSFLNYKNAVALVAEAGELRAVYYPDVEPGADGKICPGYADGRALAEYLDLASWSRRSAPAQELSSPGSIEFCVRDDYRITVYRDPAVAKVAFDGESRFYRTSKTDFTAAVALFRTGPYTGGERSLTLEDVLTLSQKGAALSWSDFEEYACTEIGSGLYIRQYRIDGRFRLLVGGVPWETPRYIELQANNSADASVDVRTGDVSAFIRAHRNDAAFSG